MKNSLSVVHTSEMEELIASEIVNGWSLETRKATKMRVETDLTLTTKVHQNEHN